MAADIIRNTEERVLILPPTTRDGQLTRSLLDRQGLNSFVCRNINELATEINHGVGAVLLTEDVISSHNVNQIISMFSNQPAWSDIPVIILMRGAIASAAGAELLRSLGNVTLLERPAPMRTVASAVQAAVRARKRQYQIREQAREREALLQSEQAARAEAERASRMKDEFLATLSHELRTPLTAILGWSTLLRGNDRGEIDLDMLQEGLTVIERNARVQTQLIEDLLDMSRIISGKIRLDVQTVEPASCIEAAMETVMPAANAKGIRLQKILDRNAGPVCGDPNRLQQIVWNLLSNAIKFTSKGGNVHVILQRVNSHIEISVTDTGAGIAADFLPHVFERFRQADATASRKYGGLGLGLAIVKHLVELHGGSIQAKSPGEGQGSTFIVRLPLVVVHEDQGERRPVHPTAQPFAPLEKSCASLEGLKVLVVDDEPDARSLIKRVLEECRAVVFTAGSADEALDAIERERPHVLRSDIGMPQTDGYELLRQVRALGSERGGKVPAIALTAFARSEDRTRALLAGYLVHVAKPVEPRELIATVASVGGRT